MALRWPLFLALLTAATAARPPMSAGAQLESRSPVRSDGLTFEIPVVPGLQEHLDLAEYPGLVAVAFENVGTKLTRSSRLVVRDPASVRFRYLTLRFISRDGAIFRYGVAVTSSPGIADNMFRLSVEIDAGPIADGYVVLRIPNNLAKLIPVELTSRIGTKIQSVATLPAQARLLAYMEQVANRNPAGLSVSPRFEEVLLDYHNQTLVGQERVHDRLPADLLPLLITLLIWLVIVPSIYLGNKLRKRHRKQSVAT